MRMFQMMAVLAILIATVATGCNKSKSAAELLIECTAVKDQAEKKRGWAVAAEKRINDEHKACITARDSCLASVKDPQKAIRAELEAEYKAKLTEMKAKYSKAKAEADARLQLLERKARRKAWVKQQHQERIHREEVEQANWKRLREIQKLAKPFYCPAGTQEWICKDLMKREESVFWQNTAEEFLAHGTIEIRKSGAWVKTGWLVYVENRRGRHELTIRLGEGLNKTKSGYFANILGSKTGTSAWSWNKEYTEPEIFWADADTVLIRRKRIEMSKSVSRRAATQAVLSAFRDMFDMRSAKVVRWANYADWKARPKHQIVASN